MSQYHLRLVAAYVRGRHLQLGEPDLPASLSTPALESLSEPELIAIVEYGLVAGLRLHRFKQTMGLARVERVLGYLQGIQPTELLDIGSGRGAFLWPLLTTFPMLPVTAMDADKARAEQLKAVQLGGVAQLDADCLDVTLLPFAENQFDVVTALEVLEHIPAVERAIAEIVRVARRFVIISAPSRPDDNPEHIHLFSQPQLRTLFANCGVDNLKFEYVHNHQLLIANVGASHATQR